ncbi:MAG: hypothetical protein K0S88_191 [Actinomycetia bacterium]|jgi:hypothetical protein|nr:hypothetical protein [Actinomycetes bacterium]
MLAAWVEGAGGVHSVTAFAAVVTAVVTCYRLRVRERMHAARLEVAQKIAEAGSTAVLGPDTVIVAPASSPLTVDELLRAAGANEPTSPGERSSPKEVADRTVPTELPPPVPPA